nr:MAG TPA: HNH endonuclease [Caudoviricetes sp.]
MSIRPHPCCVCQQLTTNTGMCDECKARRTANGYAKEPWKRSNRVQSIHKQYNTSRWRKLRAKILSRDHNLCQMCLKVGIYEVATEVDHIKPTALGGDMFDPNNLQSLCKSCHMAKTLQDKKG